MLDVLFWVSVFSGGILFILLLLSVIGGLDFDLDIDVSGDSDVDGGFGIVKGILTFVSMSAWVVRILIIAEQHIAISITGGIIVGIITVYLLSKLLKFLIGQQEFNHWTMEDTIGKDASVYLKIPVKGQGIVHVIVDDSVKELKAKSYSKKEIATGATVVITDVEDNVVIAELKE